MITREDILKQSPCNQARTWMEQNPDRTPQELWETCWRGDWMFWALSRLNPLTSHQWAELGFTLIRQFPEVWDGLTPNTQQAMDTAECILKGETTCETLTGIKNTVHLGCMGAYSKTGSTHSREFNIHQACFVLVLALPDVILLEKSVPPRSVIQSILMVADLLTESDSELYDNELIMADILRRSVPFTVFNQEEK